MPRNNNKVLKLAVSSEPARGSHLSIQKIEQKSRIHRCSVYRIIKNATCFWIWILIKNAVFKRFPCQKLSDSPKLKCLEAQNVCLEKPNDNGWEGHFSDEKDFLFDSVAVNAQNNRIFTYESAKRNVLSDLLTLERAKVFKTTHGLGWSLKKRSKNDFESKLL